MAAIQRNAEIVDRRRGVPAAGTPECVQAKGNSVTGAVDSSNRRARAAYLPQFPGADPR
jgi:hypothetical protein